MDLSITEGASVLDNDDDNNSTDLESPPDQRYNTNALTVLSPDYDDEEDEEEEEKEEEGEYNSGNGTNITDKNQRQPPSESQQKEPLNDIRDAQDRQDGGVEQETEIISNRQDEQPTESNKGGDLAQPDQHQIDNDRLYQMIAVDGDKYHLNQQTGYPDAPFYMDDIPAKPPSLTQYREQGQETSETDQTTDNNVRAPHRKDGQNTRESEADEDELPVILPAEDEHYHHNLEQGSPNSYYSGHSYHSRNQQSESRRWRRSSGSSRQSYKSEVSTRSQGGKSPQSHVSSQSYNSRHRHRHRRNYCKRRHDSRSRSRTYTPGRSRSRTCTPIRKGDSMFSTESKRNSRSRRESISTTRSNTTCIPLAVSPATVGQDQNVGSDRYMGISTKHITNRAKSSLVIGNCILKTWIKLLKSNTEGLASNSLIDEIFENTENPVVPTQKSLNRLRNFIGAELTLRDMNKCTALEDTKSAELFRKSVEDVDAYHRRQIMSNQLFSSTFSKLMTVRHSDTPYKKQGNQNNRGYLDDGSGEDLPPQPDGTTEMPAGDHAEEVGPCTSLHVGLLEITSGNRGVGCVDMIQKKISVLNRLIEYKTSWSSTMCKIAEVTTFITSRVADVMLGHDDGDGDAGIVSGGNILGPAMEVYPSETPLSNAGEGIGSVGVQFMFGTVASFISQKIVQQCSEIAKFSLCLDVPIVLLNWPKEFTKSIEYKTLLTESIERFSRSVAIPSSFIMDSIASFIDEEEEGEDEHASGKRDSRANKRDDPEAHSGKMFGQFERRGAVLRSFKRNTGGNRKVMGMLFNGMYGTNNPDSETQKDEKESSAYLQMCGMNILNCSTNYRDDITRGIVDYVDKRKMLISKILVHMISKACLNMRVKQIKGRISIPPRDTDIKVAGTTSSGTNGNCPSGFMYKSPHMYAGLADLAPAGTAESTTLKPVKENLTQTKVRNRLNYLKRCTNAQPGRLLTL